MSSPTCWTGSPQDLESRLADLQCRYDELVAKNSVTVSRLQAEVQGLQQQVQQQAEELAWIRSTCSAVAGTSSVLELLNRLRTEHEALLQRQLEDVRNECMHICSSQSMNCTDSPVDNSSQSQLVGDDELAVSVVDAGQTGVGCVSEPAVCCTTDAACSLTTQFT